MSVVRNVGESSFPDYISLITYYQSILKPSSINHEPKKTREVKNMSFLTHSGFYKSKNTWKTVVAPAQLAYFTRSFALHGAAAWGEDIP